jgi:PTH1 family peptidyl-tRNA hydrolase
MDWLILGLGNPGERYRGNRHNVGFMIVERLSRQYRIPLDERGRTAVAGTGSVGDRSCVLAEPRTFMNRSGAAAVSLLSRYGLPPGRMLVLHDDLDLPAGRVRVKSGGGHGGHNGLRSIIESLGTSDFPRVKVGIGRPAPGCSAEEWVLGDFAPEEERELMAEGIAEAAAQAVSLIMQEPPPGHGGRDGTSTPCSGAAPGL